MTEPDLVAADAVNPTLPSAPGTAMSPPAAAPGAPDPILAMIERAARDTAVDIDKFERLMAMRERTEDRHAKQAFDNAIALAKGEIGPIVKNREVDFSTSKGRTNYRYEDFAAVASAVDPVLARHGLSYRFRSEQQGQRLKVTCRVSHADGYGEETTLEATNDESGNKNAIQAVGSAATYLQRYTLKLALGLAASNDNDSGGEDPDLGPIAPDDIAYVEQLLRDTESRRARVPRDDGRALGRRAQRRPISARGRALEREEAESRPWNSVARNGSWRAAARSAHPRSATPSPASSAGASGPRSPRTSCTRLPLSASQASRQSGLTPLGGALSTRTRRGRPTPS